MNKIDIMDGNKLNANDEDVSKLVAQVRQHVRTATKSLDLERFSEASDRLQRVQMTRTLIEKIRAVQKLMDWPALENLYAELVRMDPSNHDATNQLRKLRSNLTERSGRHGRARRAVDGQFRNTPLTHLSDRWSGVEKAAQVLLDAEDHLWLLKLRRILNRWGRELAAEVTTLTGEIKMVEGDTERAIQLRTQLDNLRSLHVSWKDLYDNVREFLATRGL